jgi:hypothetical protein
MKFHGNLPSGYRAENVRTDGRTDMMKPTSCDYANAPIKGTMQHLGAYFFYYWQLWHIVKTLC